MSRRNHGGSDRPSTIAEDDNDSSFSTFVASNVTTTQGLLPGSISNPSRTQHRKFKSGSRNSHPSSTRQQKEKGASSNKLNASNNSKTGKNSERRDTSFYATPPSHPQSSTPHNGSTSNAAAANNINPYTASSYLEEIGQLDFGAMVSSFRNSSNTNKLLVFLIIMMVFLCSQISVFLSSRETDDFGGFFANEADTGDKNFKNYKNYYSSWEEEKKMTGYDTSGMHYPPNLSELEKINELSERNTIEQVQEPQQIVNMGEPGLLAPPASNEPLLPVKEEGIVPPPEPITPEVEAIDAQYTQEQAQQIDPNDVEELETVNADPVPPPPPPPTAVDQQVVQPPQNHPTAPDISVITKENAMTIAYVLPVFECPEKVIEPRQDEEVDERDAVDADVETGHNTAFLDAAAVLKYSIHRNSIHNPFSQSKYNYQLVALIHPNANQCNGEGGKTIQDELHTLGYKTMLRDIPVPVAQIKGDYLRQNIAKSSRAGEKDLIRLHAYNLVEYPVVVLLDMRSLLFKPLDEVLDIMIYGVSQQPTIWEIKSQEGSIGNLLASSEYKDKPLSELPLSQVNAFYTSDYSSVSPDRWQFGIHPGLVILRPSLDAYNELENILREGNYEYFSGWAGKGFGNFAGSMTTKGLLAYYYKDVHPDTSLELNRCVYNSMADSPFIRVEGETRCRNGSKDLSECEDCRMKTINDLKSVSMSVCRDPWACFFHPEEMEKLHLCRKMHHVWFRMRQELEENWEKYQTWSGQPYTPNPKVPGGGSRPEHFLGYCTGSGRKSYIAMSPPWVQRRRAESTYLRG